MGFARPSHLSLVFLNNLTVKSRPTWELYHHVRPPSFSPRIAFVTSFCSFGGTDGRYHYNDTWSFDISTREWTELQCTGYIPSPREGHAAALVDDVMYVFGGRGVDGADLSDLTAINLLSE